MSGQNRSLQITTARLTVHVHMSTDKEDCGNAAGLRRLEFEGGGGSLADGEASKATFQLTPGVDSSFDSSGFSEQGNPDF